VISQSRVQASLTVRKISFGQGVERIFPSIPSHDRIDVMVLPASGAQALLLRGTKGKAARLRDVE